jgi:glycosyltransferase involved in cell wall biosynthesis
VRTGLVIPALNEADVIGSIVARVPPETVSEIVVVDNGSTDATRVNAARAGASVVSEPRRGYGAACWAGVNAIGHDIDVVAFLDGDGSQHPEELPRLLAPLREGRADLVLGARRFAGGHPLHAALGSRAVAGFLAWRFGLRLSDIGPFRAIRKDLFWRLRMRDRSFGWPVEMVAKAAALRARIVEVEVSHSPRLGGRSKVSGTVVGSVRASCAFVAAALRAPRQVS